MKTQYLGYALLVFPDENGRNMVLLKENGDGLWDLPGGMAGEDNTARNALISGTEKQLGLSVVPHYQVGEDYILELEGGSKRIIIQAYFSVVIGGKIDASQEGGPKARFFSEEDIGKMNGALFDVATAAHPEGVVRHLLRVALKTLEEVSFEASSPEEPTTGLPPGSQN